MDRVKRIWYLSPMRAAKVQASLRIRAASPEPPLLAHISSESRGTFRQKARSLVPLNGWACAVKICNDRILEDTNSLDGAQILKGYRTENTVMILSFQTDMPGQTVQTQIRHLLECVWIFRKFTVRAGIVFEMPWTFCLSGIQTVNQTF